mgnify:CR=1 FL=1
MLSILEEYTRELVIDYDIPYNKFIEVYGDVIIRRVDRLLGNLLSNVEVIDLGSGETRLVIKLGRDVPNKYAIIIRTLMGSKASKECSEWIGEVKKHGIPKGMKVTCIGLKLWLYKYATLMNYVPNWDFSKIL